MKPLYFYCRTFTPFTSSPELKAIKAKMPVMTRSQKAAAAEAAAEASILQSRTSETKLKEQRVIDTITKRIIEIGGISSSTIKKAFIANLFNYMVNTQEVIDYVNKYPRFKKVVLSKVSEIDTSCSRERDCYDTYDNENRSILIACSKMMSTFGGSK